MLLLLVLKYCDINSNLKSTSVLFRLIYEWSGIISRIWEIRLNTPHWPKHRKIRYLINLAKFEREYPFFRNGMALVNLPQGKRKAPCTINIESLLIVVYCFIFQECTGMAKARHRAVLAKHLPLHAMYENMMLLKTIDIY